MAARYNGVVQRHTSLTALLAVSFLYVATVAAQPAVRRGTTILALRSYSGFYHQQVVSIVGEITGQADRLTIGNDEGSLRVLMQNAAPEGRVEARGQLLDIGRMSQDDPRLIPFNLLDRVRSAYPDRWPRPGEELVLVVSGTVPTPPATDITRPPLRSVAMEPEKFVGRRVTVIGQFRGRNLFGDLPESPVNDKWTFVIRSADTAVWVSGVQPKGKTFNLDATKRLDAGRWVEIAGTVRSAKGLTWIEGASIELAKAPSETATTVDVAPPPAPVEVLFSAPTQGETDVSPDTRIRMQLSRDVDVASLKDHVRISYTGAAADQPPLAFATNYTVATRALEIRPLQPWQRFSEVRVEFLEGIKGTDGGVLKPFTLAFTTGG